MSDEVKTTKIIAFDGKKTEWPLWSEKFKARANRKGHKSILLGDVKVPEDKVDVSTLSSDEAKKKHKKLRQLNEEACEDLVLAVNGETEVGRAVFQLIRGSKSERFKDGSASEAWKRLIDKFEPKKAPNRLQKKKMIQNLKSKHGQHPDVCISNLEDLVMQHQEAGGRWDEVETLEHICGNLPKCCDSVIGPLEKRIDADDDALTLQELRDDLSC